MIRLTDNINLYLSQPRKKHYIYIHGPGKNEISKAVFIDIISNLKHEEYNDVILIIDNKITSKRLNYYVNVIKSFNMNPSIYTTIADAMLLNSINLHVPIYFVITGVESGSSPLINFYLGEYKFNISILYLLSADSLSQIFGAYLSIKSECYNKNKFNIFRVARDYKTIDSVRYKNLIIELLSLIDDNDTSIQVYDAGMMLVNKAQGCVTASTTNSYKSDISNIHTVFNKSGNVHHNLLQEEVLYNFCRND
jgi:hypothetical protein